jgi:hypothetical protein
MAIHYIYRYVRKLSEEVLEYGAGEYFWQIEGSPYIETVANYLVYGVWKYKSAEEYFLS